MAEADDLKPWDRQPGETAKAYAAFTTYRDMGSDRTVRATAEVLTKSEQLIKTWSGKHRWVARVSAWDSMPGRVVVAAYEEMAARIAAQHEDLSTALMAKLRQNVDLLRPGKDPTVSFSTALSAARQSHQFATDLSKPADAGREAVQKAIAALADKLLGEE